ncbi:MAG TPA: hypothetical protein PKA79_01780 [Oligoflexia bacterium]|nr:hypothetical protein [Oligoflexia bacterium]
MIITLFLIVSDILALLVIAYYLIAAAQNFISCGLPLHNKTTPVRANFFD